MSNEMKWVLIEGIYSSCRFDDFVVMMKKSGDFDQNTLFFSARKGIPSKIATLYCDTEMANRLQRQLDQRDVGKLTLTVHIARELTDITIKGPGGRPRRITRPNEFIKRPAGSKPQRPKALYIVNNRSMSPFVREWEKRKREFEREAAAFAESKSQEIYQDEATSFYLKDIDRLCDDTHRQAVCVLENTPKWTPASISLYSSCLGFAPAYTIVQPGFTLLAYANQGHAHKAVRGLNGVVIGDCCIVARQFKASERDVRDLIKYDLKGPEDEEEEEEEGKSRIPERVFEKQPRAEDEEEGTVKRLREDDVEEYSELPTATTTTTITTTTTTTTTSTPPISSDSDNMQKKMEEGWTCLDCGDDNNTERCACGAPMSLE